MFSPALNRLFYSGDSRTAAQEGQPSCTEVILPKKLFISDEPHALEKSMHKCAIGMEVVIVHPKFP